MNVIPAIDLRGGRCVRLYQGDFDRETEYSSRPENVARRFEELGVTHLHLVDLDGARDGTQLNAATVGNITAESSLRIQLGGGIRDRGSVMRWLEGGVARCVIGSAAVEQPEEVRNWIAEFGADRIVLALDVSLDAGGTPMLATHGWSRLSETSLWQCLDDYAAVGARHVLCTDVSRDGALTGPNIELYGSLVQRYPTIELQASGGVRDLADLHALRKTGCPAAITGRALLDGTITPTEIQSFQRDA